MVSIATRVMQSDPYPQNAHFCWEKRIVICLLKIDLYCLFLHVNLCSCPNERFGNGLGIICFKI